MPLPAPSLQRVKGRQGAHREKSARLVHQQLLNTMLVQDTHLSDLVLVRRLLPIRMTSGGHPHIKILKAVRAGRSRQVPLKECMDTVPDEQDALGREAAKCYTARGAFR